MRRADRKRWAAARTLADLGKLTAQWLEGEIASQPGYQPGCGPDPETAELIPVLAGLNRAGFVTICSQPGEEGDGQYGWWRQCAAVEGFADDDTLDRLQDAVAGRGLILLAQRTPQPRRGLARLLPGSCRGERVLVTTVNGEPYTAFGAMSYADVQFSYEEVGDEAFTAVLNAWQVTIADSVWARNEVLWPVLAGRFLGWSSRDSRGAGAP